MSRFCKVCNRGPQMGFKLSHAHNRTKRRWSVNLQKRRFLLEGKMVRGYVCTKCLGADKICKA